MGGINSLSSGRCLLGRSRWNLFAKVQHQLFIQKLVELERAGADNLHRLHCDVAIQYDLADLRLYRAQLKRLLGRALYYLKVVADDKTLYKIGVTKAAVFASLLGSVLIENFFRRRRPKSTITPYS